MYIRATDYVWQPGKHKLEDTEYELLMSDFARYIAKVYAKTLIKLINTQRWKYKWKKLSKPYLEWKKKNGMSLNIWEATGLLKRSISVRWAPAKGAFVVGPSPRVKYTRGNVDVLSVARYMEYGTSKMPARPLFGDAQKYISKNIDRYWRAYLKGIGVK